MDVLLIDDHPMIHETLSAYVRAVAPEARVHAVTTLEAGIEQARALQDLKLVLLDLGLPGCTGLQALHRFRKPCPDARVVVVSASEDAIIVHQALRAGAVGYLPKTSTPDVMLSALRIVFSGGTYVPSQILEAIPHLPDLSERQIEVLRALVRGATYRDAAKTLGITPNTMKQYAHDVYRALGVSSRAEASAAMRRLGIDAD